MTRELRSFRYPLQPFLKKNRWEEQALRQELTTAREASVRLREQQEVIASGLSALDAQLAEMHRGSFDADRHQRVIAWREEQEALLQARQREVGDAEAGCEQIAQQLARAMNAVRGHENYRIRLLGEHHIECEREDARQADDAWLLRRGWLEKNA